MKGARHKKQHIVWLDLHKMPTKDKPMETESGLVAAWDRGWEWGGKNK